MVQRQFPSRKDGCDKLCYITAVSLGEMAEWCKGNLPVGEGGCDKLRCIAAASLGGIAAWYEGNLLVSKRLLDVLF